MGIKVNAIVSSVIGLFTFCIYPFVMGIIILCNSNKFENKGHAIATGIILIFYIFTAVTFFILPIVFSCLLKVKTKEEDDDY